MNTIILQIILFGARSLSAQVTVPPDANDYSPSWSPDGSKIAFTSEFTGEPQIFIIEEEGSGQIQITTTKGGNEYPSWSPDGEKIAFVSHRDGNPEIYTMSADGSGQQRLTNNSAVEEKVSWSPDGSKILFYSNRTGVDDIFVMGADGSDPINLTQSAYYDFDPAWSPDGARIAFVSNRDGGNREIYVMDVDGKNQVRLTQNLVYDGKPAWSRDSSSLLFHSGRYGFDIYSLDLESKMLVRVTFSRDSDLDPEYSPDGTHIVFNSRRDGRRGIYVINADGSESRKLTNKYKNSFLRYIQDVGVDVAIEKYLNAQKRNPGEVLFLESELRALAYKYLDGNQIEEAVKLFELNVRTYPQSVNAYSGLADAYQKAGRNNPPPSRYQCQNLILTGQIQKAARVYNKAKTIYPDWRFFFESSLTRFAKGHLSIGQHDEAIECFKLVVDAYPKSANAYVNLGDAYLKSGSKDLAARNYQNSLELNPKNASVAKKLAELSAE